MSALAALQTTGRLQKPPRLFITGPQKIGKSTFGAGAPNPVFIQIEDGLDGLADPETGRPIEVAHFPQAKSLADVKAAVVALMNEPHEFKTAIVDSVDWLEPLIWAQTCADEGWPNIEAPGYGKGYVAALKHWRVFMDAMNALRDKRGMAVILLGHVHIKRFDDPVTASHDRYLPKLQERAGAFLAEAVDVVGFAQWEKVVVEEKVGFNATEKKARGSGRRMLYLEERPAFPFAGSRYRLPAEVKFNWNSFIAAFNEATQPKAQAA